MELAKRIDHTLLKADASMEDVERLCKEALKYGFHAVCVNPYRVPFCVNYLKGSGVKVCSVVGFPLGATVKEVKAMEARFVAEMGADEIDYVINIGVVKDNAFQILKEEMYAILDATKPYGLVVKAIVEVPLLDREKVKKVCKVLTEVDFLKTSTGLHRPVTVEDVKLLVENAAPGVKVKAAGGIRSYEQALRLIEAGTERLGCSRSVEIIEGRR